MVVASSPFNSKFALGTCPLKGCNKKPYFSRRFAKFLGRL